jgi:CRISPR-associated protein Csd1
MILNRLYELAVREKLLAEPAFEQQPVPYVVQLDEGGKFLGITEQRGEVVSVRKTKKGEEINRRPDKGFPRSVPRPHGNTANPGFARYFVDTLPRVLPVAVEDKDRAKLERSRATFWQQIDAAADATNDPALRAIQAFGRQLATDDQLAKRVENELSSHDPDGGDRVTFAYYPHGGTTILQSEPIRSWYSEFFKKCTAGKQADGPTGFCTLTGTVGPLPTSHPIPLMGVPEIKNGKLKYQQTGVKIVSFDKQAFQHYGLDGAANAAIGYEAADAYARAFQWLRAKRDNHFIVGGTLFMFWTRQPADTEFVITINDASPEQVKGLLEGVAKGKPGDAIDDVNDFYLLALSGNSARAIVRDYLERPVPAVHASVRRWFADLSIVDASPEYRGQVKSAFPLRVLATAMGIDQERVASDVHVALMEMAIDSKRPIPIRILAGCLSRLRADGGGALRASRAALVKICLIRRRIAVSVALDTDERNPAYLYGRLLSLLDQIQNAALGEVNASVVDKYYRAMSVRPQTIAPRLIGYAQAHLRKMRADPKKKGTSIWLSQRLTELVNRLPLRQAVERLPISDQGVFVMGFYHQQADRYTPKDTTQQRSE